MLVKMVIGLYCRIVTCLQVGCLVSKKYVKSYRDLNYIPPSDFGCRVTPPPTCPRRWCKVPSRWQMNPQMVSKQTYWDLMVPYKYNPFQRHLNSPSCFFLCVSSTRSCRRDDNSVPLVSIYATISIRVISSYPSDNFSSSFRWPMEV